MFSRRREFLRACAAAGVGMIPPGSLSAADEQASPLHPRSPESVARDFPALSAADAGFVYLDSAATTHRARPVIDAITRFYVEDNANPARVHARARRAAAALGDARAAVAKFLNAADPLEVVFTRGTTEAVNLAAQSWGSAHLRPGDEVLLTISEHASNLMPWVRVANATGARVRILDVDAAGHLGVDRLGDLLTSRTRLVAVSHASNVLGIINPVKTIAQAARAVGARTFIDGAQGAPHIAIDVQDLGCDFYAFSGHKLCGPMGAGSLWARRDILDSMVPYHVGSNMAHAVEFEGTPDFEGGALRFQAGTPDVAAAVGLAAAVRFLERLGRDALWSHDQALVKAAEALTRVKTLRMLGDVSAPLRIPVFSFVLEGRPVSSVVDALDRRGIGVRGGDLAALPLLKRFGTTEAVRASAYVYSSPDHIERLTEALREIAGGKS
jgi:cysteine desulfurase/selenocysteine lyase